ncbi:MAG: DUF1800 family protein [Pyrinomonadaceae bacterium]
MTSGISRTFLRILTLLALVSAAALAAAAQDGDPNSPTPVLLSEEGSTRAIAQEPGKIRSTGELARATSQAFQPEEKVELFVTSLDLMADEGANAFRVYATDRVGHQFRFPVIGLEPVDGSGGVYRVTIVLKDEIGFWDAPQADGDLLIYLTWRGLASNTVRLGYGAIGGDIKEDPASRPTPFGTKIARSVARPDSPDDISYRWAGDRFRFAEQATFGPNTSLDNTLRRIGLRAWINQQFAANYPSAANPFPTNGLQPVNQQSNCNDNDGDGVVNLYPNCGRDTYTQYQPQTWFMKEAIYGDAQLKHRVNWALGQVWVTSGNDIQQGRHMVEWWKTINRHSFGNYRNLMKEMTLNATMGDYLSMRESTRLAPNENYAREIMQLFTVGLFMLNQDGTLQLDGQGNPIPTYTQDTINNLTRVLTGWSFCSVSGANCPTLGTTDAPAGVVNYIDPMLLNPGITTGANNRHDIGAKTLLTYTGSTTSNIAACPPTGTGACGLTCNTGVNCTLVAGANNTGALAGVQTYANASLEQALDNIFNHPNVGPFVSKILIQHMVTSDPTPAYVGRVAAKFNNNGSGVRGDMKAVIRAILLDPEARGDVKSDPNYGKLREPVSLTTNFLRALNARGAAGSGQFDGYITGRGEFNGMAQVPFMAPTVFNYFPPGYGVPGTTLIGQEFAIMNTGTSIQRANFMNRMIMAGGLGSTTVPIAVAAPNSPTGLSLDLADLQALVTADTTNNQLLDELNRRLLHGTLTAQNRTTMQTAINSITVSNPPTATQTLSRVQQALYLVATSSQYQVQR